MPLSFRRSFKKIPSTDLKRNKRLLGRTAGPSVAGSAERFRPTKYPLVIPIGCGAALGLCLFVAVSRAVDRLPGATPAPTLDYGAVSTSAFETALARQLGTVQLPQLTATPAPSITATITATQTLAPVAVTASNPWAADVPAAACIPADLPQTGRVVEVLGVDAIRVLMDDDGRVYSVRYLGADASQVSGGSTGFTLEAMQRHTDLVFRKQAILVRDITDSDANGILLRYVIVEGVFVNHALVSEGLARAASVGPDTACQEALLAAEHEAQAGGLGMWGGRASPTP